MTKPSQKPQYPAHIASLKPYIPGLPIADLARRLEMVPERIAKLASNENPLGPSPQARAAMAATKIDLSQYPDNDCTDLVQALAEFHGVPPQWIVVGAGSESVIGNAVATNLSVGRKTAYSQYSFQAYVNAAQRVGAEHIVVPSPEFTVDLEGLKQTLSQEPSLIYIANPGNPTGTSLAPAALGEFLASIPAHIVVLLDEAYFDFLPAHLQPDSIGWVKTYPNLLITRTFSKAYGLAGLRVGYGIAQPALADMLRRVRPPFTVSQPAQVAATAALQDREFLACTLENNARGRRMLVEGLRAQGLRYLDGHTNFVLVEVGDGAAWTRAMEQHGLIVRPVNSYGLAQWVRVSIGKPEEMQRLLDALETATAITTASA
jgi:histidinol-phosphate aminotransferase